MWKVWSKANKDFSLKWGKLGASLGQVRASSGKFGQVRASWGELGQVGNQRNYRNLTLKKTSCERKKEEEYRI